MLLKESVANKDKCAEVNSKRKFGLQQEDYLAILLNKLGSNLGPTSRHNRRR